MSDAPNSLIGRFVAPRGNRPQALVQAADAPLRAVAEAPALTPVPAPMLADIAVVSNAVAATCERCDSGTSTIGADFTITGHVVCRGRARLDGKLQGNIECKHLVVGADGCVTGDIKADDVVVYGRVEGSISGTRVSLMSGASVDGDIVHQGLSIEMGASFTGRSSQAAEPEVKRGRGSRKTAAAKAAPRYGRRSDAPKPDQSSSAMLAGQPCALEAKPNLG